MSQSNSSKDSKPKFQKLPGPVRCIDSDDDDDMLVVNNKISTKKPVTSNSAKKTPKNIPKPMKTVKSPSEVTPPSSLQKTPIAYVSPRADVQKSPMSAIGSPLTDTEQKTPIASLNTDNVTPIASPKNRSSGTPVSAQKQPSNLSFSPSRQSQSGLLSPVPSKKQMERKLQISLMSPSRDTRNYSRVNDTPESPIKADNTKEAIDQNVHYSLYQQAKLRNDDLKRNRDELLAKLNRIKEKHETKLFTATDGNNRLAAEINRRTQDLNKELHLLDIEIKRAQDEHLQNKLFIDLKSITDENEKIIKSFEMAARSIDKLRKEFQFTPIQDDCFDSILRLNEFHGPVGEALIDLINASKSTFVSNQRSVI